MVNLFVIGFGVWVATTKDDKIHCKQSRRAYNNDMAGLTQCIADCDGITNPALITAATPTNCFLNNDFTVFLQSLIPAGLALLCTLSATIILFKFDKATLRQFATGSGPPAGCNTALFIMHSVFSLLALLVDAAAAIWNAVVAPVFLLYVVPCALLASVCVVALLVQIPVVHVARMNGTKTTRQLFDDSVPDTPRRKTTSASASSSL